MATVRLGATKLQAGDAAIIEAENEIRIDADATAEVLLFDVGADDAHPR